MADAVGRVEIEITADTTAFDQALARVRAAAQNINVGGGGGSGGGSGGKGGGAAPTVPKPNLKPLEDSRRQIKEIFRDIASSVAAFQGPLGPLAGRVNFLGTLFGRVGIAVGGASLALAGLALIAQKSVRAFAEEEEQLLTLNAVLKATGYAAGQTSDSLAEIATTVSRTTLATDDQVRSAEQMLLTFKSVSGDAFPKTIAAAQDLAAVMGIGVAGAARMLGRAMESGGESLGSLTRAGITFTAAQKDMIRRFEETGRVASAQEVILNRVRDAVGGAGAGQASGLSGAFHRFSEGLSDVASAVGGFISNFINLPAWFDAATKAMNFLTDNTGSLGIAFDLLGIRISRALRLISAEDAAAAIKLLREELEKLAHPAETVAGKLKQIQIEVTALKAQMQAAKDKFEGVVLGLKHEAEEAGKSALEQEVLNKVREAGVEGMKKFEAVIRSLVIWKNREQEVEAHRQSQIDRTADIKIAEYELTLVGKSIQEQNRLRDAFAETTRLRADAAKKQIPVDEAELKRMREKADAIARINQQLAEQQKTLEVNFERQTMFLSKTEQQVASTMQAWFPTTWQDHMQDAIAQQVRLNSVLSDTYATTRDFAGTFAEGMLAGKSATDALTDAMSNLQKKLIDMALDAVIQGLFSMLLGQGTTGGNIFSQLVNFTSGAGAGAGGGTGQTVKQPLHLQHGGVVGNKAVPTYKGGKLDYDEYPAILHVGERVIPAGGDGSKSPRMLHTSGRHMIEMFGGTPKFEGGWGNFGSQSAAMAGAYTAGDTGGGGSGGSWGFTGGDTGFGQGGSGEYRYTPGSGSSGGSTSIGTSSGGGRSRSNGGGGDRGSGFVVVPGRRPGEIISFALPPPSMGSFGGTGLGRGRTDDDALFAPGHEVITIIKPKIHLGPIDTTGEPPGSVPASGHRMGGYIGSTPGMRRFIDSSIFIGAPKFAWGLSYSDQGSYNNASTSPNTSPSTSPSSGGSTTYWTPTDTMSSGSGLGSGGTTNYWSPTATMSPGSGSLGWGSGGSGGTTNYWSPTATMSPGGTSLGSGSSSGFASFGSSNILVGGMGGGDLLTPSPFPIYRPGTPNVLFGQTGAAVTAMQTQLASFGYNVDIDGDFGPQTLAALRAYERDNAVLSGVPTRVPGKFGPQDVINAELRRQGIITGGGSFGVPGHTRGRFGYGGGGFGVPGGPRPGGAAGGSGPVFEGIGATLTPGLSDLLTTTAGLSLLGGQMEWTPTSFGSVGGPGTFRPGGFPASRTTMPDFSGVAATTVQEPGSTVGPGYRYGGMFPWSTAVPRVGGGGTFGDRLHPRLGGGYVAPPSYGGAFPWSRITSGIVAPPTNIGMGSGSGFPLAVPFNVGAGDMPGAGAIPSGFTSASAVPLPRPRPATPASRPNLPPMFGPQPGLDSTNWSLAMRRAGLWRPPPSIYSPVSGGFPPGMPLNVPFRNRSGATIPPYPMFQPGAPVGTPPRPPGDVPSLIFDPTQPRSTGLGGAAYRVGAGLGALFGGAGQYPAPPHPVPYDTLRPPVDDTEKKRIEEEYKAIHGSLDGGYLQLAGMFGPVTPPRGLENLHYPRGPQGHPAMPPEFGMTPYNIYPGRGIPPDREHISIRGLVELASMAMGDLRGTFAMRPLGIPYAGLPPMIGTLPSGIPPAGMRRLGTGYGQYRAPGDSATKTPGDFGMRRFAPPSISGEIRPPGNAEKNIVPQYYQDEDVRGGIPLFDQNGRPQLWRMPDGSYKVPHGSGGQGMRDTPDLSYLPGARLHTGGVVGSTPVPRTWLPSSVFRSAPRFAQGLSGNEYPAVLHRGERVVPAGAGGGGANVTVNVINNSSAQVQTREREGDNGTVHLDILIDEVVSSKMRDGGSRINRTMATMGARGQPLRR